MAKSRKEAEENFDHLDLDARDSSAESEANFVKPAEQTKSEASSPRLYAGQELLNHDLFRLKNALMFRNVSYSNTLQLEPAEHSHFFHTIDSNGKKLPYCGAIGGHFHEMTVVESKDGVPQVTCGPAVRWVTKKVNGKRKQVAEPIPYDTHTHVVEYISSERISQRKTNQEYVKFQSMIDSMTPRKVDGVVG